MHPEAIEVLVAMGEYAGTQEAFLRESAAIVQAALQCSPEIADHIIHNLMNHGGINFDITPGGGTAPNSNGYSNGTLVLVCPYGSLTGRLPFLARPPPRAACHHGDVVDVGVLHHSG